MDARLLDLIKNPESIEKTDLAILSEELQKKPYLQSLRAIYLLGISRFEKEKYKQELATTAAYTTDKKILYHFITRNDRESSQNEKLQEKKPTTAIKIAPPKEVFHEVTPKVLVTNEPVYIDGELNRILFKGEEDFLERGNDSIDMEATIEQGKLVTKPAVNDVVNDNLTDEDGKKDAVPEISLGEKSVPHVDEILPEAQPDKPTENPPQTPAATDPHPNKNADFEERLPAESFSKEKLINESETSDDASVVSSAQISFHALQEFLPEVQIARPSQKPQTYQAPKPKTSKPEIEMQRLIAEVEAKIKSAKSASTKPVETVSQVDKLPEKTVDNTIKQDEVASAENPPNESAGNSDSKPKYFVEQEISTRKTASSADESAWKPMQFSQNTPDALLQKKEFAEKESSEQILGEKTAQPNTELSKPTADKNVASLPEKVTESNVPTFINTWQTWLKIERKDEKEIGIPVSRKDVIEKFIEKEPKISKLKDDSDFVPKEKGNNISHLMTETLAQLYVDQKLYAMAIKAYETLSEKHPDKAAYFQGKIAAVKELRKNP